MPLPTPAPRGRHRYRALVSTPGLCSAVLTASPAPAQDGSPGTADDTDDTGDVLVRDRTAGTTTRVSAGPEGVNAPPP